MKTNFEKHVAAFDQVLGFCNNLGSSYSPVNESMTIAGLTETLSAAREALSNYNATRADYLVAINNRNKSVEFLPYLGTQVYNLLIASKAGKANIEDVKVLKNRFRSASSRRTKVPADDGSPPDTSRGPISQLDVESKIRNLGLIIGIVKKEPAYAATEDHLSIEGLEAIYNELVESQRRVHAMKAALKNAALRRDEAINGEDGVRQTTRRVKKYLLAAFGSQSKEYNKVRVLRHSNL